MYINRLNYENYFLLYVDGELSATEMQAVDRFAAENKDLFDELQALLETKLPETTYHFENNSSLYRTSSEQINSINCEEKFLLLADDALTEEEKIATLHFVSRHPEHQELFNSIQQTILPIEVIAFPNKETLFRKEENVRPLIFIKYWKLAASAIFIGLIVLVGIYTAHEEQQNTTVKLYKNDPPSKQLNSNTIQIPASENNNKTSSIIVTTKNTVHKKSGSLINQISDPNLNFVNESLKTENTKHIDVQETIALNTHKNIGTNYPTTIQTEVKDHSSLIVSAKNNTEETESVQLIKPAIYKELDTDDERKSLYVGAIEINKDKLRGFLRKASSLFKGRIKNEEDKTEISNTHTLE